MLPIKIYPYLSEINELDVKYVEACNLQKVKEKEQLYPQFFLACFRCLQRIHCFSYFSPKCVRSYKGFAYLLCWPWRMGMGLVCKRRFSFHEFYNFFLFNLLTFIFLLIVFFFSILDIYPRRFLFYKINIYSFFLPTTYTHTHDPQPLPTTHDPQHLATLDIYLTSRRPHFRPKRDDAIDGLAQFLLKPKDTNISFSTSWNEKLLTRNIGETGSSAFMANKRWKRNEKKNGQLLGRRVRTWHTLECVADEI